MNGTTSSLNRVFFQGTPSVLLIRWFAFLILIGTLLLMLPWAHARDRVGPLDALFTSASAVCVTGLTVVDTGRDFTLFGQLVILLLIQLGGLGILTFAGLAFQMFGARMPVASESAIGDSLFQQSVAADLKSWLKSTVKITLLIEGAGAALLFFSLAPGGQLPHSAFSAAFHSVSAFCNAGFSLYSNNLCGLRENIPFVGTIMILIVLGGIGHIVLLEASRACKNYRRSEALPAPFRFSFHSRVAIRITVALILTGALGLGLFDWLDGRPTEGGFFAGSLFQSITARTAGFNTISISALPPASILLLICLMFIGGSPGSCAGGIKTTSFALALARIVAGIRNRKEVSLMGRALPDALISRAVALIGLALLWNAFGAMLLAVTEFGHASVADVLFEQTSAFGTVGLSTGITPHLTTIGRIWIVLTMFAGRIGPLTLAFSFVAPSRSNVSYPEGKVMIG